MAPVAGWAAMSTLMKIAYVAKIAMTIAAIAYSSAQQRKMKKQLSSKANAGGIILTQRDPVAPREIVYGTRRKGGTVVFMATSKAENKLYNSVIALADCKVNAMKKLYINDEPYDIKPNGYPVDGPYKDHIRCRFYDGDPDQQADQILVNANVGWKSTDRLRGVSYMVISLIYDKTIWANGDPQLSVLMEGAIVYDPRDGQHKFSDNPALCLRHCALNSIVGLGCTEDEIDDESVIIAANICDELVELKDGTFQKRYTCNGVLSSADTRAENCNRLAACMAGSFVYSGGKWKMLAGAYRPPVATFTLDDMRGPITTQTDDGIADAVNGVRGTYAGPGTKWQPADFPAVENALYLQEDKGQRYWLDTDYSFTTDPVECQRLSKIELEKSRQATTVKLQLNAVGLLVEVGDTIQLPIARYGWDAEGNGGKQFEIIEWSYIIDTADGGPTIGVDITARETAPQIYEWNKGEETTIDIIPPPYVPNPGDVPNPKNLRFTSGDTTAVPQPDGTVLPRVKIEWDIPDDAFVVDGGRTRIEYKKHTDPTWTEWGSVTGDKLFDYVADVQEAITYDFRLRHENSFGAVSQWVTKENITVEGSTTKPPAPTGLVASSAANGAINLLWDRSTDQRVYSYAVYRATSDTPELATFVAEISATAYNDNPGSSASKSYYYWISAITGNRIFSDKSESVSVEYGAAGTISVFPPFQFVTEASPAAVSVSAPAGAIVRYTTDSSPVMPTSSEWQKSGSDYAPMIITSYTTLRVVGYIGTRPTEEFIGYYIPPNNDTPKVASPSIIIDETSNPFNCITTLSTATSGANIYYKLSGKVAADWTLYTAPFQFSKPMATPSNRYVYVTVEAQAKKADGTMTNSAISSQTVESTYGD